MNNNQNNNNEINNSDNTVVVTKDKDKKSLSIFNLVFKILVVIFLALMSFWIFISKKNAVFAAVTLSGVVITFYALYSLVNNLKKHNHNKKTKILMLSEVVIDILIAVFLFYGAYMIYSKPDDKIALFVIEYFRFFIGSVFYIKGVYYFITKVLFLEDSSVKEFWINILLLTVGAVIYALNIEPASLANVIAIISIALAVFLVVELSFHFGKMKKIKSAKKEQEEQDTDELLDNYQKTKDLKSDNNTEDEIKSTKEIE